MYSFLKAPCCFMPVSHFGIAKASSAGDPQERVGVLRGGPTRWRYGLHESVSRSLVTSVSHVQHRTVTDPMPVVIVLVQKGCNCSFAVCHSRMVA